MSSPEPTEYDPPPPTLDAPPTIAACTGGISTAVVSWALAAGQVVLDRGFEARDLIPFALWSVVFGLGSAAVCRVLLALTGGLGLTTRHLIGVAAGVLGAFGYTLLVAAYLGPWIG